MHADIPQLLSLRDGEPLAAELTQHIVSCTRCALELARLQGLAHDMQRLAQFEAPPHSWAAIRKRLDHTPGQRAYAGWKAMSAAAAIIVLVALTTLWWAHEPHGYGVPRSGDGQTIGQLVSRSQQLEAVLQRLPQRPSVERASTCATIDELQNRIEMLDLQLSLVSKDDSDRARAQQLWSTRVQLLNSLVYVRYAEAARDGYQPTYLLDTGVI